MVLGLIALLIAWESFLRLSAPVEINFTQAIVAVIGLSVTSSRPSSSMTITAITMATITITIITMIITPIMVVAPATTICAPPISTCSPMR